MFNRRNSLRNSNQRYSGLSPAAAAAMVSFNQQNPRQNSAALAAGAAAEALRRHSLDAQGAQMVANFRRNSITSQSGRTSSMTRRNSLRTSSTVNRDQYGRAMSLTTTTVRQMGSFELVKEEETAVRRPRGPQPPESIYSLESLAEEPEYHRPAPQQHRQDRGNRSRVSFLDDTAEFHYEAYDTSESNALAAAAAVAPQRHLKPNAQPQSHKPRSPMKSALKKNIEASPISYSSYDEPEPIYEDEEDIDTQHYKNRPLSAVSEFSAITAKSHFESSDEDEFRSSPEPVLSSGENEQDIDHLQNHHGNQEFVHEDYSPSEDEEFDNQHSHNHQAPHAAHNNQPLTVDIPDNENNFNGPHSPSAPSELPSLARADVSPLKKNEHGEAYPQNSPPSQTNGVNGSVQGLHKSALKQGSTAHHQQQHRTISNPSRPQGPQAPRQDQNGRAVNGQFHNTVPNGTQRKSSLRSAPNQGYRSQPIPRQGQPQAYQSQGQQVQRQHIYGKQQQQQQQQQRRSQQPQPKYQIQYQQAPKQHESMTKSNSFRPSRLSLPPNVGQQYGRRPQSPQNKRDSFVPPPSFEAPRQLQPSPSIDGFNRIASTNDILEKARNRARAFSPEQHEPVTIAGIAQAENDDAASVNSESSWKRSTTASRSKFRSSVEMSPPGRRPASITSSQFGGSRASRISSPTNGRTYSLRGAPPPDLNRNWRSRFEDSDDEDTAHAPTALPQISTRVESSSGRPAKKPGFFKRLFSKHI